jgi:hypothetical protein
VENVAGRVCHVAGDLLFTVFIDVPFGLLCGVAFALAIVKLLFEDIVCFITFGRHPIQYDLL